MNQAELWPVLLVIILNSLLAVIIFVVGIFQKRQKRSTIIMLSLFFFIVPLMGLLYILLGFFLNSFIRKGNVDMSDVSFNQEREKIILSPDQDIEMNYVPIQDAIAVSDTISLRRLLLDTMLSEAKKKVSDIAIAMSSTDTEASHYVATIIMDTLSELRSEANNMLESMKKFPEDVEMNLLTFDYIYEFLSLNIMSDLEQESYIYTLDDVAENLFTYNLWYMTARHYLMITDLFISIKDYIMAEKWIERASQYRPNMLDTYKAKLHLYFEQHNNEAFFKCLDELKNSDIIVDKEILDLFHVYYNLGDR